MKRIIKIYEENKMLNCTGFLIKMIDKMMKNKDWKSARELKDITDKLFEFTKRYYNED